MAYLYLAIAIVAEVVATSFMKQTEGFTRIVPTGAVVIGYGVAFFLLSLALRDIPTGVAYAIWAGSGIVLVAAFAWLFQGQVLDTPAILGMALIVTGVGVMNLFSTVAAH